MNPYQQTTITVAEDTFKTLYVLASCGAGVLGGFLQPSDTTYLCANISSEIINDVLEEAATLLHIPDLTPDEANEVLQKVKDREL